MDTYEIISAIRNQSNLSTEKELTTGELLRFLEQATYLLGMRLLPLFSDDIIGVKTITSHTGDITVPPELLLLINSYRKNEEDEWKLCHKLDVNLKPVIGTTQYPTDVNYPYIVQMGQVYEITPALSGGDFKLEYRKKLVAPLWGQGVLQESAVTETYNTTQRGNPIQSPMQPIFSPCLYYYSGRTYALWLQRGGAGYNLENMIMFFDHNTKTWSPAYGVGYSRAGAQDHHGGAALIVSGGYIIVAHEKLSGTNPSDHNSPMKIKRSNSVEDITSFTEITEIDDYLAYPTFCKLSDGTILLIARYGPISTDMDQICVYKSTDDGLTWAKAFNGGTSARLLHLNPSGGTDYWAYHGRIPTNDSRGLYLFVNKLDYAHSSGYPVCYLLYTEYGVTMYNIDRSFSKNIDTAGEITQAEMDAYFVVDSASGSAIRYICTGTFSPNGNIYLLQWYGDRSSSPNITKHYLIYFQGGAWTKQEITGIFTDSNFYEEAGWQLIAHTDSKLDMYVTRTEGGVRQIQVFRTEDRGITWTKLRDYTQETLYDYQYLKITENWPDCNYLVLQSAHLVNSNWTNIWHRVIDRTLLDVVLDERAPIEDDLLKNYYIALYERDTLTQKKLKEVQISIYDGNNRRAGIPLDPNESYNVDDGIIYATVPFIPREYHYLIIASTLYYLAVAGYIKRDPGEILQFVENEVARIYGLLGKEYQEEGKK